MNWLRLAKNQRSIKPLSVLIQELRIIKSDYEIEVMKKSGQISAKSFIEVKKKYILKKNKDKGKRYLVYEMIGNEMD